MDSADISNRFAYHAPADDEKRMRHADMRSRCGALAQELNVVLPEGREKSLAITKLEEVMFWSNAAIARS